MVEGLQVSKYIAFITQNNLQLERSKNAKKILKSKYDNLFLRRTASSCETIDAELLPLTTVKNHPPLVLLRYKSNVMEQFFCFLAWIDFLEWKSGVLDVSLAPFLSLYFSLCASV